MSSMWDTMLFMICLLQLIQFIYLGAERMIVEVERQTVKRQL